MRRVSVFSLAGVFWLFASIGMVFGDQRITASLRAEPADYQGEAPARITFHGTISATEPGRVQYRFLRSDGALAPVRTLQFSAPGTKPVSTTWTLGRPGFTYDGWQAIEVLHPRRVISNRAQFSVRCQSASRPDLRVVRIFLEDGYKRALIENRGDSRASNVFVRFYVDGAPSSIFGPVSVSPGQQVRATSQRLPQGTHRVRVVVDPDNRVAEANESNNSMEVSLSYGGAEPPLQEDRISFDPNRARVQQIGGRWKIVDGNHWLFDFGNKQGEARRALAIIKHYGMNQSCFVGRPDPSFCYMLVSGRAPQGPFPGEDSVSFNPRRAEVKRMAGRWKIVDGDHLLFDFGNKRDEAQRALAIIQKYGFTRSCFVGRPDPSFSYLRR